MNQNAAKPDRKKSSGNLVKIIIGLLFILMAYWIIGPVHHNEKTPNIKNAFYAQKVEPEINRFDKENQAAAKHAMWKIKAAFNDYRNHTPEFVEDLSSITTQAAMAWKGGKDFTNRLANHDPKAKAFREYTQKKFEKHFFTQKQLESLLEDTLLQYADDVKANQNRLHMRVENAWKEAAMPGKFNWAPVMSDVNMQIETATSDMGIKGIESIVLATIGGSIVGKYSSEYLVELSTVLTEWIAKDLAISCAVTAGESGVMVAAPEGGAAAGSVLGGPVGGTIGFIGGMVGWMIADHFIQKHFKKKMTLECNNLLTAMERGIINGRPGAPGLLAAMQNAGTRIAVAERQALKKTMTNG